MWPLLRIFAGRFSPLATTLMLPVAAVIGFIGYNVESLFNRPVTPTTAPIRQQREERLLKNETMGNSYSEHQPLEVNLSPSLS